ncbi:MAG: PKD domain-containing protein [Chloroflexi bacterium]|nr:PKD domain-containing protein [Chloroflexota bacterium]
MKGRLPLIAAAFLVLTLLLPPAALAAPLAPTGLEATVVNATQVDLAWTDSSTDEAGFRIERSTDGVTFVPVGTAAANANSFSDATAPGGGTFSYRVIATGAAGHSAPSNVASVTFALPNAPSGLAATLAGGPTGPQVNVTWTDNSDNETGFRVEQSLDNFATPPGVAFTAAANTTTYSDTTVVRPNTYYYRAVAVNAVGGSAASNSASAGWVGPVDPAFIYQGNPNTSFPGYYADNTGTRVALLPADGAPAPQQIVDPPDPTNPYQVFLGMGEEGFYYIAETSFNTVSGKAVFVFAIEANVVNPGDEVVFTRVRLFAKVPVAGTYKFKHPWGEETIEVTQDDIDANRGIRFTNDLGLATRSFLEAAAASGPIDGFLHQTVPAPPAGWIGDGVSLGPVIGSPTGFNKVRLTAPNGVNLDGAGNSVMETDQFTVAARLQTTAAPSPSFTKALDPASCVAPCTVTLTDTSTGGPTARSWDFGDGTKSTIQNPSKDYNSAGTYTIMLTVTNAGGKGSISQTVNVYSTPAASFTKTLPDGLPPVAISFTDTSTGNPTSWSWDFGDGTSSTLQNPTKVYALPGSYNATLTVTNAAGSASTGQTVGISGALVPSFTASTLSGVAPVTVDFTDASTGTITSRSWNFADGSLASTELNPSHVFSFAGTYTVTLTVTDATGSAAALRTVQVYTAPVAGFTKSTARGVPPLVVNFTDTSTGNPTVRHWTFGDGTSSTERNPRKVFASAGAYDVTLTVSNPAGSAYTTQTVIVTGIDPSVPLRLGVGPIDPISIYQGDPNTGFPGYYEDDQGTRIALLPITGDGLTAPTQIFEPVDPNSPYSVFLGAGEELFYWDVTADFPTSAGRGIAVYAVEANFVPDQPGQEVVFTRTRFRLDVPVPGDYTIEHPYGTDTFSITQDDMDARGGLFFTEDIGLATHDFFQAGAGRITRFLRQVNPAPPAGWIGDGATAATVTGSPTGFNKIRVTGPVGVNLSGSGSNIVETDLFVIGARLLTAVAPTASFTKVVDPVTCFAPCTVTLTDTSTGAPTGWSWDFGDGTRSAAQNPTKIYNTGGTYAVTLTAANAAGTSSVAQTVTVYAAPVAGFTKSAATGIAPVTVGFSDTSTGNVVTRSWDFGDGTTSTLQNPNRVFAKAGTYTVTLTVTNPVGTASTSQTITVESTPARPSSLAATPVSANQTDLAWTDNASNELGYFVQRSTDGAAFATLAVLPADTASYSDTTVAAGSTYAYRVVTFNLVGDSLPSDVAGVSLTVPAAPSDLSLAGPAVTQVDLSWTDNADSETGFRVERSTDGAIFALAGNVAASITAFSDTAVAQDTKYIYRVFAVNVFGDSAPSNTLQVTAGVPAAPSTLTAEVIGPSQVNLAWLDVANTETGFRVERSTDGIAYTVLGTTAANAQSYGDTSAAKNTTYSYRVLAVNDNGASASSNVVQATTPNTIPAAPSALHLAAPAATQVDLSWTDNADNETGFRVERSTDGATFALAGNVAAGVTAFSDAAVAQDTVYTYRVFALNVLGNSGASNTLQVSVGVPTAPSTLTAEVKGPFQVDLTWLDVANTETGFRVERSTDGIAFTVLGTTAANAQSYSDTSAAKNTTYSYRVFAVNNIGASASSNVVQATTPNTIPDGPSGLSAAPANPDRVTLTWTDNSDNETSFLIERSTGGAGFAQLVRLDSTTMNAVGTQVSYTDTGVVARTTYTYRVKAGNELGDSPASNVATVATPNVSLTGLTSPTGVTVDTAGVVQANATVTDNSGKGKLDVAQGTRLRTRNGAPLTELTAAPLAAAPPQAPPQNTVVLAIDYGPDGADFNPPLTVTMTYDPATLPAGVRENKLQIALWDGANWLKLNSTVNTQAKTITAKLPHFTVVGILGEQEPPPTAIPTPVPTATPIPAPTVIPEAQVVPVPQVQGETAAIVQPTTGVRVVLEDNTVITVPPLAMPVTVQMKGRNLAEKDLPKLPTRGKVTKVVEIEVFDDKGVKIESVEIRLPITIEVPLSADDLAAIGDDPNNVELHRYDDGTKTWVKLASELDLARKVVRAQLRHLSLFAVVVPVPVTQAQPTPTAAPPSAGGEVPGGSAWLLALVIGLGILLFGYRVLRGARQPIKKD